MRRKLGRVCTIEVEEKLKGPIFFAGAVLRIPTAVNKKVIPDDDEANHFQTAPMISTIRQLQLGRKLTMQKVTIISPVGRRRTFPMIRSRRKDHSIDRCCSWCENGMVGHV